MSIVEPFLAGAVVALVVGPVTWWCRHYAVRFDLSQRSPFAPA
jgi:hypothetical protein